MAHIYKNSKNTLHNRYQKNIENIQKNIIVGFMLSFVLLLTWLFGQYADVLDFKKPVILIVIPIPFIVALSNSSIIGRENATLQRGMAVEKSFATLVSQLPNNFYGFQNAEISFNGKSSEMDMIVVGPTGIFIIEVKNLSGTILGDANDFEWIQKKASSNGKSNSNVFYNPIKQVGNHVHILASYLRQNGINATVYSMVYFSNPSTVLSISNVTEQVPVYSRMLHQEYDILKTISERDEILDTDEINQICNLIN